MTARRDAKFYESSDKAVEDIEDDAKLLVGGMQQSLGLWYIKIII